MALWQTTYSDKCIDFGLFFDLFLTLVLVCYKIADDCGHRLWHSACLWRRRVKLNADKRKEEEIHRNQSQITYTKPNAHAHSVVRQSFNIINSRQAKANAIKMHFAFWLPSNWIVHFAFGKYHFEFIELSKQADCILAKSEEKNINVFCQKFNWQRILRNSIRATVEWHPEDGSAMADKHIEWKQKIVCQFFCVVFFVFKSNTIKSWLYSLGLIYVNGIANSWNCHRFCSFFFPVVIFFFGLCLLKSQCRC